MKISIFISTNLVSIPTYIQRLFGNSSNISGFSETSSFYNSQKLEYLTYCENLCDKSVTVINHFPYIFSNLDSKNMCLWMIMDIFFPYKYISTYFLKWLEEISLMITNKNRITNPSISSGPERINAYKTATILWLLTTRSLPPGPYMVQNQ